MEDEKQLCEYATISHGATLYLVLRLPGGGRYWSTPSAPTRDSNPTRDIDPTLPRSNNNDACIITCTENSPDNPVFVMPCGHPMSPDGLMDYCWNEIGANKHEILCPLCNKEWTIDVIVKYGCASKDELHELETGLSRNFCLKNEDIIECPSCTSFCERMNKKTLCTLCLVCSHKKKKQPHFCWQCLREWKNDPSSKTCGDENCSVEDQVLLEQLASAPIIKPEWLSTEVPSIRACPTCGTMILLREGCKHMECPICKIKFCFVCLRKKMNGSWSCGSFATTCVAAPRQTRITHRQ